MSCTNSKYSSISKKSLEGVEVIPGMTQENRTQESGLRNQDSEIRTQESGIRTQESGLSRRICVGDLAN